MSTFRNKSQRATGELQQAIEPLASYISAADHPKAVLRKALAVLYAELEQTNRLASARLAAFTASQWS